MAIPITVPYYLVNAAVSLAIIFFCFLRFYDILELATHTPMYSLFIFVIPVAIIMLFTHPSVTFGLWTRRIGILIFVSDCWSIARLCASSLTSRMISRRSSS
jgi:hypothetical protein